MGSQAAILPLRNTQSTLQRAARALQSSIRRIETRHEIAKFTRAIALFDAVPSYRIARALHRGESELARRLPQARETSAANTAAAARADLLHPGVARYLREAGLLK